MVPLLARFVPRVPERIVATVMVTLALAVLLAAIVVAEGMHSTSAARQRSGGVRWEAPQAVHAAPLTAGVRWDHQG